jgi:hypothetical protein
MDINQAFSPTMLTCSRCSPPQTVLYQHVTLHWQWHEDGEPQSDSKVYDPAEYQMPDLSASLPEEPQS